MGMARHSNPAVREGRVEKLSMAAFLASEYPALLMEPLDNLTNFHSTTVPGRTDWVNAERWLSGAPQPGHSICKQNVTAQSPAVALGIMCLCLPNILVSVISIPCRVTNMMNLVTVGNPRSDEHLRRNLGKCAAVRTDLNNLVAEGLH